MIGLLNTAWLASVAWGCLAAGRIAVDPLSLYLLVLFILPVLRKVLVMGRNAVIGGRNARRAACAEAIEKPAGHLAEKLEECKELRIPEEDTRQQEVAYTTERNLLEQQVEQLEVQVAAGRKREAAEPAKPAEPAGGTIDLSLPDADPDSLTIDIRQKEPDEC